MTQTTSGNGGVGKAIIKVVRKGGKIDVTQFERTLLSYYTINSQMQTLLLLERSIRNEMYCGFV